MIGRRKRQKTQHRAHHPRTHASQSQSSSQRVSQSNNQLISSLSNPDIAPSSQPSFLDLLPVTLFQLVCKFLVLEDKCARLLCCSWSINQVLCAPRANLHIDKLNQKIILQSHHKPVKEPHHQNITAPNAFYSSDTLLIDTSKPDFEAHHLFQLRWIDRVRSIQVKHRAEKVISEPIWLHVAKHIAYALTQPTVKELVIDETISKDRGASITQRLIIQMMHRGIDIMTGWIDCDQPCCAHSKNKKDDDEIDPTDVFMKTREDQRAALSDDNDPVSTSVDCYAHELRRDDSPEIDDIYEYEEKYTGSWDMEELYPRHRLEYLKITIMEGASDIPKHLICEMSILVLGVVLQRLEIETDVMAIDPLQWILIVKSLPPTLTCVKLPERFCQLISYPKAIWPVYLQSADYLPVIRHLVLGSGANGIETGPWLSLNMNLTHQPRPWEVLPLRVVDNTLQSVSLRHLKRLMLDVPSDHLPLFSHANAGSFPLLEHISIICIPTSEMRYDDFEPLLTFLSSTHIRSLAIILSFEHPWAPMSSRCTELIGRMHSLRELEIKLPSILQVGGDQDPHTLFEDDDEVCVASPNSWPNLMSLSLSNVKLSLSHARSLFQAAPALRTFMFKGVFIQQDPTHNRMLVWLGSLCHSIETIDFGEDVLRDPVGVAEWREWLSECSFLHLQSLRIRIDQLWNKCLHMLIQKLKNAPLKLIEMRPGEDLLFRESLFRDLKHLEYPPIVMDPERVQHLGERVMSNGQMFSFYDNEVGVRKFNHNVDDRGMSGRDCYFEEVYRQLSSLEKQRLAAWDSDNYDFDEYQEDECFINDDIVHNVMAVVNHYHSGDESDE